MAEVVVFHHALGLTDAVRRFADALSDGGHSVHTPDLYDGRTFATIEEGMAHSEEIGGPMAIVDLARAAGQAPPSQGGYLRLSPRGVPARAPPPTPAGA